MGMTAQASFGNSASFRRHDVRQRRESRGGNKINIKAGRLIEYLDQREA